MNFFEALQLMRDGKRVRRADWPDRVYMILFWFDKNPVFQRKGGGFTHQLLDDRNKFVGAEDILADDWEILLPITIPGVHPSHVVAESLDGLHYMCANDSPPGDSLAVSCSLLAVRGQGRWFVTTDGDRPCTASTGGED